MSRVAVQPVKNGHRSRRVAALHCQGDSWRLVIVESANGGASADLRVIDARTMAFGDSASVRAALGQHDVERLVRVLAASSIVCRVVPAPEGSDADASAALGLLTEASLPAGLAPHRRAAARLDAQTGQRGRTALLMGWPGESGEPVIGAAEETWTAEPVALLWMLRRRCRAVLYADRSSGSLCILVAGADRMALRALRETHGDEDAWRKVIESRFAQTAAAAGVSLNGSLRTLGVGATTLVIEGQDSALVEGVSGALDDAEWLSRYALGLAAAAGALVATISTAGLFELRAEAPALAEAWHVRWSRWLGQPRNSARVIAAALLLALLGPLAMAGARYAILNAKSGGLERQQEQSRTSALTAAFHDQLGRRRWPMTRLLAELSASLPVGMTIESVRLESGQRATVSGRADTLELVNLLQAKLNDSGVFASATIDRTQDGDGGGVEFDLTVAISHPYGTAKGLDDFATQPLAQRLYGDRAIASLGENGIDGAALPASSAAERAKNASGAPERSVRPEPSAAAIPPALTDADIAGFDAKTAMKQWTERQKASKQPGLEAAIRDRLKDEAEKCRQRMLAARKEATP